MHYVYKSLPLFGNFSQTILNKLRKEGRDRKIFVLWWLTGYFSVYRPCVHVLFVGAGSCSPWHVGLKVHLSAQLDKGLYSGIVLWFLSFVTVIFDFTFRCPLSVISELCVFLSRRSEKLRQSAVGHCHMLSTRGGCSWNSHWLPIQNVRQGPSIFPIKPYESTCLSCLLPLIMSNPWT